MEKKLGKEMALANMLILLAYDLMFCTSHFTVINDIQYEEHDSHYSAFPLNYEI